MEIPVNSPLLNGNEKKYLLECIETGWISSSGSFIDQFETRFAELVGRKYAVAVTNGTVALDLAINALQIGEGDEVIIPTFTIVSCASSVVLAGAKPVVVDCTPDTWNIDTQKVEENITPKTKAIMPVHIYGLPVDMDPLLDLAKNYKLHVIEDAAEAHGLMYRGKHCGSFGDISTFSFFANKLITTGEGGMLVTDEHELYERINSARNLCFNNERRFVHEELGTNARMTNMQAAIGVAQLETITEKVERKREIGHMYSEAFADLEMLRLPLEKTEYAENIYWVYGIVANDDFNLDALELKVRLAQEGIDSRPFFFPIHQQPVFLKKGWYGGKCCPVSEQLYKKGLYIPSGLGLENKNINRVIESVRKILLAV